MISLSTRACIVSFTELGRWDPSSFYGISWNWPPHYMRPIGSALKSRRDKIDRTAVPFSSLQPITIHFDGTMDRRRIDDNCEYTMDLFSAKPGDIVVAKIDLKNGAVGIVPNDWDNVVVTSHFAIYEPDLTILLPEYLHLIIQTPFFKSYLWRNKVGAEGRKEVKLDFFEAAEIPLPGINVQRAIVTYLKQALQAVVDAKQALSDVTINLDALLNDKFAAGGISGTAFMSARWLVGKWEDMDAWDMKNARAARFRKTPIELVAFREFAEEATELARPMLEPDKEWPVYGVNNKVGVVFSHRQKGRDFNAPYKRIRQNWFFHNPTRSSVGSLGIVPDVPEDAITSPEYQVWRLKDTAPGILSGYIAVLIRTQFFINLVRIHRVGGVKQRLYVDNLLSIHVPCLPLDEQKCIADAREEVLERVRVTQDRASVVKSEVAEMILGVQPAPAYLD